MNTKRLFTVITTIFLWQHSQGQNFSNLDFEHPIQPLNPVFGLVPTTNAIPGWTAYIGGNPVDQIVYNTRPLDAAEVTLQGTNSDSLAPIQGDFTVALFGASIFAPQQSAGIGQTGQIPAATESLIFWGYVGLDNVSFEGQTLSLVVISNALNYTVYGADISPYAGQIGQLLFTAPPGYEDIVDNIQFSTNPVPEPSEIALLTLGALLFGFRRWRDRAP